MSNQDKGCNTWWDNPWWLKPEWAQQANRSLERIQEAFCYLASIFPSSWFQSIAEEKRVWNILLRHLIFGQSTDGLRYTLQLSDRLQRLSRAQGFEAVLRRLKTASRDSGAADLELQIADIFDCGGYVVQFPVPSGKNGKTPDIIAKNGEERLAIECKSLWEGDKTTNMRDIFMLSNIRIAEIGGAHNVAVDFQFNDASLKRLDDLVKEGLTGHALIDAFLGSLPTAIENIVARGSFPRWLIHPLGKGYLRRAPHGAGSRLSHPEAQGPIVEKIMANGIGRAARQVAASGLPGLVVIFTPTVPKDRALGVVISDLFDADQALYESVMAVILLPQQYLFHWISPTLIINRHAKYSWQDTKAAGILNDHWQPVIMEP